MWVAILLVGNANTPSGGIHSERLLAFGSWDNSFLFGPTTMKSDTWSMTSQPCEMVPAPPGNKILQVASISEVVPAEPAVSDKRETLERVILLMSPIFLQHTLHHQVLLHNSNSYLCFVCLFCLSAVHHQVFVDKTPRDGRSTCCQLMFLVANWK